MSDKPAEVAVVIGSESDLEIMRPCLAILQELKIPHEVTVASAHRSPERAREIATTAQERGLKVIIAAAGWAAHLPGVLAAYTTLPVIGVPISSSPIGGLDALYSIVQMPPGVPVAAVGIDTARNAGILAAQILALSDPPLAERLKQLKEQIRKSVDEQAARVAEEWGQSAPRGANEPDRA